MSHRRRVAVAALGVVLLAGCAESQKVNNPDFVTALTKGYPAEVTVTGVVTQLLPDSNGPAGPHEDFDVAVSGHVVEIDHNLTLAPRVPVAVGDAVTIHGQFEPDPGRPVIHYTHHATATHEGGWIMLAGRRYS